MNHATFSIRDAHRSYSRGCRCMHCRIGHRAYQVEYRRGVARETSKPSPLPQTDQMELSLTGGPSSGPGSDVATILRSTDEPQGLRTLNSPAVGKHHRHASATEMAAAKRQVNADGKRGEVLQAIADSATGRTRHEVADVTKIKLQTVCGRVAECFEEGWVEETDRTRPTESGSPAAVLKVTARGLAALRRVQKVSA